MMVKMYVGFRNHETIVRYDMDRRAAFYWVREHADELACLHVDCGLNDWTWSPDMGWVQYHAEVYVPGSGVHRLEFPPTVQHEHGWITQHGNGLHARHPWRFCMDDALTLNPLAAVRPSYEEDVPF